MSQFRLPINAPQYESNLLRGLEAHRPADPGVALFYYATDTEKLWYCDPATGWTSITDVGGPDPSMGGDLTGVGSNATIAPGAVTTAKLGNGAVTTAKIADGTILNADVSPAAGIALSKLAVDPSVRANHTGTQPASTISDFTSAVRANRLDQMAAAGAPVNLGGQRITNVGYPTGPTDAATKAYADAQGLDLAHGPVKTVTTANIVLNGLQTVNGHTLTDGERVLVKNQVVANQNGVYDAHVGAWSRSADGAVVGQLRHGSYFLVEDGDQAGTSWIVDTEGDITPGITPITFTQFALTIVVDGGGGGDSVERYVDARDFITDDDGTTDNTTNVADAIAATPVGGVLDFTGLRNAIRVSAPIDLLEQRTYLFRNDAGMWPYRQTSPYPGSIKALAGFTGDAVVRVRSKALSGRAPDNDTVRVVNMVVDASAISAGNVDCVRIEGLCRDLSFDGCAATNARGTGKGFHFLQGAGTAPPRGVRMTRCVAYASASQGFRFNGVTDSHFADLLAVSCVETGIYATNSGENTFDSCRAVFNGFHGWQLDGTTTTGMTTLVAPATDRNGRNGILITQTGTQPIQIIGPRLRRDGASSTNSNYAGLAVIGTSGNTVVPVDVIGGQCTPGVNDGGGGNATPQHAVRVTYAQRLNVVGGDLWGINSGISDAGNNTVLTWGPDVVWAQGAIGAKVRQDGTERAGRSSYGIVARQEIGGMPGPLGITLAPARWYNDLGYPVVISQLRASVGSAPVGASVELNVRLAGADNTTLSIADGANASSVAPGPIVIPNGSYADVTVTQVGSSAPGADLVVSAKVAW